MATPMRCKECGTSVLIPDYRKSTFKFCSRSCGFHWKAKHDRVLKTCLICEKPFTVIRVRAKIAKYCSPKCYHKAMKGRGSVTIACRHCNTKFQASPSTNRIYCSRSCINKENQKVWKPKYTTVRKTMRSRGLLIQCTRCGYSEVPQILGVHHKDRNKHNNALRNLEVLCPNCHSLEHLKHTTHAGLEK